MGLPEIIGFSLMSTITRSHQKIYSFRNTKKPKNVSLRNENYVGVLRRKYHLLIVGSITCWMLNEFL